MIVDKCLDADPGVTSSIPARSHTSAEIDHDIISTAILLHCTVSRSAIVSYKRKYVHEVLVNYLVKLAPSLGSSLIIFSSFLFFRSLVKNDSLGNFDFNRQSHLDFSSNFVG